MTQRFSDDPQAIPAARAIAKGIILTYTVGTHKADVQLVGSHPTALSAIRVATNIPTADVVAGRQCTVLFLDPANQDDAVVLCIQGASPSGGGSSSVATDAIWDAAGDLAVGTGANTATRLAVGAANSVLQPGGGTVAWTTTPTIGGLATFNAGLKLASAQQIIDSDGTGRYKPATASPHNTLTGDVKIASGKLGVVANPDATIYGLFRDTGVLDGYFGLCVDLGLSSGAGAAGNLIGVTGRAMAKSAATSFVYGLSFLAGAASATVSATDIAAVLASLYLLSGSTAEGHNFEGNDPVGSISIMYGFRQKGLTVGTERHPFYDDGTTEDADKHANVFKTSTQFFSTTIALGGGAGVMGIANAAVVPSSNPAGGGVLYAQAGALKWRGSGGTVTTIAPA